MTRGYSASEVGQTVARTVELCRQVGDRDRLLVATWRLLSFHILRAEYASTRQLATSLVDHEQKVGNQVFAATGYRALGAVAFSEGGLIEAREHLQRAIALIDAEPDPPLVGAFEVDPGAFARDFLALDLCLLGEAAMAEQVMDEALAAARHRGDPFTVSFSLHLAASLAVFQGDAPRARYLAEEAFAVATKHGYGLTRAIADTFRAWAASELGDRGVATNRMKHGLEAAGSAGAAQWRHFLLALLAQALWRRGRPRAALSVLDNALAHTVTTGERFYEPEVHRLRAEILLGVSPDSNRREAEAALRRAASVARSQSSVLFLERAETALRRMT
jgi:adenylate cyclase